MTPESIVVSLEWAKKLKEAGWPQDIPNFIWSCDSEGIGLLCQKVGLSIVVHSEKALGSNDYALLAAPTAEEILRRLPEYVGTQFWSIISEGHIRDGQKNDGYTICYPTHHEEWGDTLANALAAMYCYLAENKLLPSA